MRALEIVPAHGPGREPHDRRSEGVRSPPQARERATDSARSPSFRRRGRRAAPEMLRSDLYGEPVEASINLRSPPRPPRRGDRLPAWLPVEGSAAWGDFQGLEDRKVAPVYHLAPLGWSSLAQASVAWQSPIGWRVLGRYTRRELEIRGTGLGVARSSPSSARESRAGILPSGRGVRAVTWLRWLFDIENRTRLRACALELESWPFTSTTVDLLGLRRIYRARGEARWYRAPWVLFTRSGERHFSAWGSRATTSFPRGPSNLARSSCGFGSADRHEDRLGTRRLQLAALSLGFGLAAGTTRFDLAAQQFVFAKALKTGTNAAGNAGTAPEPSGVGTVPHAPSPGWSGVEIRASVSRSFGPSARR